MDTIREVETNDTIDVEDMKEIAVVVGRTPFSGIPVGINVAVVTTGMAMGIVDVC